MGYPFDGGGWDRALKTLLNNKHYFPLPPPPQLAHSWPTAGKSGFFGPPQAPEGKIGDFEVPEWPKVPFLHEKVPGFLVWPKMARIGNLGSALNNIWGGGVREKNRY